MVIGLFVNPCIKESEPIVSPPEDPPDAEKKRMKLWLLITKNIKPHLPRSLGLNRVPIAGSAALKRPIPQWFGKLATQRMSIQKEARTTNIRTIEGNERCRPTLSKRSMLSVFLGMTGQRFSF